MKKNFLRLLLIVQCFIIFSCEENKDEDPSPAAKNVTIIGVEVVTMPLLDGNENWDVGGDADVYFSVSNSGTMLYKHPTNVSDVNAQSLPLKFIIDKGYKLPMIDQIYKVSLFDDDDLSGDDLIGEISFNPSAYRSDRPEYKTFTNGIVQIRVNFAWE